MRQALLSRRPFCGRTSRGARKRALMGKSQRGILMRYARLIGIAAVCATIAATLFISARLLLAQAVTPTPYNPYPPGILPSDLNSEIARVQREIRGIFKNYLAQW